jgi:tetratricopeptide (TPR) repeat protein
MTGATFLGRAVAPLRRWGAMLQLQARDRIQTMDSAWDFENLIASARDALDRDQRSVALEIWRKARANFPQLAMDSESALQLLIWLREYDEAEALMQAAHERFPRRAFPLEGLAQLATNRGQHEKAVQICADLRRRHPGSIKGYWMAAAALSALDRAAEAEKLMEAALHLDPSRTGMRIEYAKLAERRGNWPEAMKRWQRVDEENGHIAGGVGIARCLRKLGRFEEADQIIVRLKYRKSNEPTVWIESALIAEDQAQWEEAAARWAAARKRFPRNPGVLLQGLPVLRRLERGDEIDAVLAEAVDTMRDDPRPATEFAMEAQRRSDWEAAASRWALVREGFPNRPIGYDRGAAVLERLGRKDEAAALRAARPSSATPAEARPAG